MGTMTEALRSAGQCRVQQSRLRRFQLSGVTAATFDVEKEVVAPEDLRDVGLQRDEVGRVLRVAANRDRAGHVPVNQAERTAEQVDAGGNDRGTDAVVVEDQRLDQVIEVALVIRDVDDAAIAGGRLGDVDVLVDPLDLAKNGVERMLQRPVDGVALGGAELVEIPVNALAGVWPGCAMPPAQIPRDVLTRQHCLGNVIEEHGRNISRGNAPP